MICDSKLPVNEEKLLRAIGLCVRARKVLFGTSIVCDALRRGSEKPVLVLEAGDTSENTHKRLTDKCKFYGVRHVRLQCDGERLAAAVGKSGGIAAVGITDPQMCHLTDPYLPQESDRS